MSMAILRGQRQQIDPDGSFQLGWYETAFTLKEVVDIGAGLRFEVIEPRSRLKLSVLARRQRVSSPVLQTWGARQGQTATASLTSTGRVKWP